MKGGKLGTIIELPDGRRGTVVYNGLDGVGIKWGELKPPKELHNYCPLFDQKIPDDIKQWRPQAMLREPYPNADLPCVGEDFEIISKPR